MEKRHLQNYQILWISYNMIFLEHLEMTTSNELAAEE